MKYTLIPGKTTLQILCLCLFFLFFLSPFLLFAQVDWRDYPGPLNEIDRDRIQFGYLKVPETRDSLNNRTLKIAFCILKCSAKNPAKDPILVLPGGPGGSSTQFAQQYLSLDRYRKRLESRDIILFDPRGCGFSEPELCPSLEDPDIINAMLTGVGMEEYYRKLAKIMAGCRDSLIAERVNLNAYGSSDIAEDIEDLRKALAIPQWNLLGGSYGTRYAQGVIRKHPETVRCAVIPGLVPVMTHYEDQDFYSFIKSIRLVIDQCENNPGCKKAFPELEGDLISLIEKFDDNPVVLPPGTTTLLPRSSLVIDGFAILRGLFNALYTREGIEMIPLMISKIKQGEDWILEALALSLGGMFDDLDRDIFYFIRCNDNPNVAFLYAPPFEDPLVDKLQSSWRQDQRMTEYNLCESLGILLDSAEQISVLSNVRALLFTGEFDPITPAQNSEIVARSMPRSTVFVVPGYGHDAGVPDCTGDMVTDFIKNPDQEIDLSCLQDVNPVEFISDITLNRGISSISTRFALGNYMGVAIPGVGLIIIILTVVMIWPIRWAFRLFRKSGRQKELKVEFLVWIHPILILVFVVSLYLAIMDAFRINPFLLAFGLPGRWGWIFWIFWITVVLFILSLPVLLKNIKAFKYFWPRFWMIFSISGTAAFIILCFVAGIV